VLEQGLRIAGFASHSNAPIRTQNIGAQRRREREGKRLATINRCGSLACPLGGELRSMKLRNHCL
jgi:hypothetical protein